MAAHAAALSDTQDLAEELLYAEARMGDMLAACLGPMTGKNIGIDLQQWKTTMAIE